LSGVTSTCAGLADARFAALGKRHFQTHAPQNDGASRGTHPIMVNEYLGISSTV
jgi:hypothetical protein